MDGQLCSSLLGERAHSHAAGLHSPCREDWWQHHHHTARCCQEPCADLPLCLRLPAQAEPSCAGLWQAATMVAPESRAEHEQWQSSNNAPQAEQPQPAALVARSLAPAGHPLSLLLFAGSNLPPRLLGMMERLQSPLAAAAVRWGINKKKQWPWRGGEGGGYPRSH